MSIFEVAPALAKALAEQNYHEPTPVQQAVLAPDMLDRDILVSAQTGSGKTVAYGLAMAHILLAPQQNLGTDGVPLALVIAPTRELALQVARELQWLYRYTGARIVHCVGGMDQRLERRKLADGATIVVGTPGRLRDHLERNALNLNFVRCIVLDEADEMLNMGFREDLEFILRATPTTRRTLLFSATLPKAIVQLAQKYQNSALRIEVSGERSGHADIEYRLVNVHAKDIERVVVNLLRQADAPTAIVFCNTRESVRHLQAILQERGFKSVGLSGELSQHERNIAMQALRDGRARVCVATDVAARGIDLPQLTLVIHADLPNDWETLKHRSGRTGRAGRKGISALLVPASKRRRAERLLQEAKITGQWIEAPSAEAIRLLDQERLLQSPVLSDEAEAEDQSFAQILMQSLSSEAIARALAKLLRASLPVPEELSDPHEFERSRSPQSGTDRDSRTSKRSREKMSNGQWFRLDIGRTRNADPKWLLPLLCRNGGIQKLNIGSIRIFDSHSEIEIDGSEAEGFYKNFSKGNNDNIGIKPIQQASSRADKNGNTALAAKKTHRKGTSGSNISSPPRERSFKPRAR